MINNINSYFTVKSNKMRKLFFDAVIGILIALSSHLFISITTVFYGQFWQDPPSI